MIHNLHEFFSKTYAPIGHGVKAAELLGVNPVRDPGQVHQPEGEGLATQVGEDRKLPPRALHKQDPQDQVDDNMSYQDYLIAKTSTNSNKSRFL